MSKFEPIHYPDGSIVLVGRVPRSRLGSLEALLRVLQERWLDFGQDTQKMIDHQPSWEIFKAIADLFPRGDRPGLWGFDLEGLKSAIPTLENLFLYQLIEGEYQPSRLIEFHDFEPVVRLDQDDFEPIPSSGDTEIDLFASLSVGFSVQEAIALFNLLDAQALDQFLYYSNEMRRDPEERGNESLARDFSDWKEENIESFREGLGINFSIPTSTKKD